MRYTFAFLLLFAVTVRAEEVKPPALTVEQRQQIQLLRQQLEIGQLKMRLLEAEFDAAKAELIAVLKKIEVPGYEFNVTTLNYDLKPSTEKPETPETAPKK